MLKTVFTKSHENTIPETPIIQQSFAVLKEVKFKTYGRGMFTTLHLPLVGTLETATTHNHVPIVSISFLRWADWHEHVLKLVSRCSLSKRALRYPNVHLM